MKAILVAVLLAGCTTLAPVPESVPTFTFTGPVFVAPGGDVEATIHVTHDGTILICSHGGFYQPSPLWVSRDDGDTFERLDPQPNPFVSGDCDLASGPDGQWAIVYDTIFSSTVAASDDGGQTWDLNHASALPIAVDRPWLHWAGDELYMTYSDVMVAQPALQMFARSTDGGRTWLEHTPINVAEPPDELQAIIGKMVVHEDTIRVPLARGNIATGGDTRIDHAVSHDRGRSWSMEAVVDRYDVGGLLLPAAALAGDRVLQVVPVPNGTVHDILVITLVDGAWSDPVHVASAVDFPGVVGPWIAGRPDGSATLAWVHHVEEGWTVSSARLHANGTVEGPVMLAEPESRDQGIGHEFIMVDHHPDGRAMVAWIMNTGPECDPEPNDVESRGSQCVYLAIEI